MWFILIGVITRHASYTTTILTCNKDLTNEYHEELKFRFDVNNELVAYYRKEVLSNMDEEGINSNYAYFQGELEKVKDNLNDNFKYTVNKNDNSIEVNTYINVAVYKTFFTNYINNESINSSSSVNDVEKFLKDNSYNCKITKR